MAYEWMTEIYDTWQEHCDYEANAQFDYIREAYGNQIDPAYEAYCDDLDCAHEAMMSDVLGKLREVPWCACRPSDPMEIPF